MRAGLATRGEGFSQMKSEREGIPGRSSWSFQDHAGRSEVGSSELSVWLSREAQGQKWGGKLRMDKGQVLEAPECPRHPAEGGIHVLFPHSG